MAVDVFLAKQIEGQVRLDGRSTAILIVDLQRCPPGTDAAQPRAPG